ncbi:MAG: FliH/SctL family protein [Lachnospiraceae bacterium]|nr:FliH/SctL family protein [Lachnospiraceae bacterium]
MLSKCLIKANQVILKENDPVVVDTNELVARKMKKIYSQLSDKEAGGFQTGLNVAQVEAIPVEERQEEAPLQEENIPVMEAPVYSGPSPEELIAQAEMQIEAMQKEAQEQLEAMREYTLQEWREKGYKEGQMQAVEELKKEKQALQNKAAQLEAEYQDKITQLEPEFIEVLTGIYEEIFKVDLAGYKPVLLNAISNTIRNIEGGRDFIVHVSKADYEAVSAAKDELFAGLATALASIEIVEDITLGANQCMIETSNGIYDCSIGSQVEELGRKLRLLSYEK